MTDEQSSLGLFERYLSIWVAIAITSGVALGVTAPEAFEAIARFEYGNVNFVVAVFIWVMIYPMMVNVDFASIKDVGKQPKGLVITLVINWLIKPFTMAALGWLFFNILFEGLVSPQSAKEYIAGMILLGVAPCTAMVFVWSQLVRGNANYTLVQVSINDLIMIVAFAPITAFLLGLSEVFVPWGTLFLSVILYVLIPLAAGYYTRRKLNKSRDQHAIDHFTAKLKPFSILGLLAMVVLLFGFQAQTILNDPLVIGLIAAPLLIQSYGIFGIAFGWGYIWRVPFSIAAPAALIGTSNFFELAVAVAISLFGLNSGAALATVVGVLVEVPVMLSLVAFANKKRKSFQQQ